MARRFARLGFTARLALAETSGGAHALARYAPSSPIIPQGKIAEALAPLPMEALRLDGDITRLLRRLGLKRIGQLYDLPRASLERRFHSREAAEAVLHRLDQALGRREEPRTPLLPAPDYAARLPFPEPLITHEGVVAGLDHLAEKLCQGLTLARRGARRVSLALYRADGTSAVIDAGLSAPSREPSHLARLFEDRVGAVDVGFGVDLMVLSALATEPLLPAQTAFARREDRARPEPLIDRLASRLSGGVVCRLFSRESHIPERAQETLSALARSVSWPEQGASKPPRPCLLLAEPEPLDVLAEIPEGPPARFTWRRVTRRVVKAEGPERIAPEWWRELVTPSPGKGEGGDGHRPSPGGDHAASAIRSDPYPGPPPFREKEVPWGKLAAAGLHEIKSDAYRDAPAALAFALAFIGDRLVKRKDATPLLWCLTDRAAREWGAPYGPGLISFGLDPALVLIVQARNGMDAAWALEEGLKARAFTAALGQIEMKTPIIARRLGLAAQTSRTPCLLLSGHQGNGLPGTLTRWRVAAERSSGAAFDAAAPGRPAWHLTLERCRGMAPARSWTVEFRDVAYGFRLAPRFADRAAGAEEERQALSG
jgi:protein ImuB